MADVVLISLYFLMGTAIVLGITGIILARKDLSLKTRFELTLLTLLLIPGWPVLIIIGLAILERDDERARDGHVSSGRG